jgi:hypothetical protein
LAFSCNSKTKSSECTEEYKKEIIDREVKTWEYSKTKELDKLKEILADDYVGYFGKKTMTQQDVISSLEKATVRSYELINVKVKAATKDVAIMYYLANQNGVKRRRHTLVPKVAAAATYLKRNGVWYSVFYQETVLD